MKNIEIEFKDSNDIRETYLNFDISGECGEYVWVKKLRNILNSDIHEKPLGCKINNTHIRIGEVHLDAFYEAQILFSHAHWVQRFANELCYRISKRVSETEKAGKIVLLGYETYIEPVMYQLKVELDKKFVGNKAVTVEYCIFEEEKYAYLQTLKQPEIRYIENAFSGDLPTHIFFICGISTTLKTFERMREKLEENFVARSVGSSDEWETLYLESARLNYFSIIQVLPELEKSFSLDNDVSLEWNEDEKWTVRRHGVQERAVFVPYIVDVKCGWNKASCCKNCYPEKVDGEKPIIKTSETSVVPIQRILLNKKEQYSGKKSSKAVKPIDFFKKDDNDNYLFKDYLYYGHIVRAEHHFLYYVRTNHLFADIISDKIKSETFSALAEFKKYCKNAWKSIKTQMDKDGDNYDDVVHIIISPSHFSSKMFCNAINQYVFNFRAHVISFDPQKEYRSNFETKYSNYAYFLEQIKGLSQDESTINKKLLFYFVDDQIITGSSYYRMTSLIKNLIMTPGNASSNIKLWNGVFVVLSRNSDSTKKDYLEDITKYYSLFDIAVPSVRSFADSCPLCKMRADAEKNEEYSILDCNAKHWMEKASWHKLLTLEEVKRRDEAEKGEETKKYEDLKNRRFRRFYCENQLQKILGMVVGVESVYNSVVNEIDRILSANETNQCEYLISCIKALSRPFIYYREDVKPVALKIIIGLIEGLLRNKDIGFQNSVVLYEDYENMIIVKFKNKYEVYSLLEILINCLAAIDSTYLLSYNSSGKTITEVCKIAQLYGFVQELFGDEKEKVLTFIPQKLNNGEERSFYMVILNAIKRMILGISGEYKSKRIEELLVLAENNGAVKDFLRNLKKDSIYSLSLVQAIFLENSVEQEKISEDIISMQPIIEKYELINKHIRDHFKDKTFLDQRKNIQFLYYDKEMEWRENDFCVYVIDEYAQRKPIVDLLEGGDEKDIKMRLLSIGFYNNKNKFLIKLHGYKEKDMHKDAFLCREKEVFLLVSFTDDLGIKRQLEVVRDILKFRKSLTSAIRDDIDLGAIKSAVQAVGMRTHLGTQLVTDHGGVADWTTLAYSIYNSIKSDDEKQRRSGYEMLNVLMNEIISFGASRETLYKYFGNEYISETGQLLNVEAKSMKEKCYTSGNNETLVARYFQDRANRNIFPSDSEENGAYEIHTDDIQKFNTICYYPCLFCVDRPIDDTDGLYQVFFIGIVDTLIRNAIKHGKTERNGVQIGIKLKQSSTKPSEYSVVISNKKMDVENSGGMEILNDYFTKDESTLLNSDEAGSGIGRYTTAFFTGVLPKLVESLSKGKVFYRVEMSSEKNKSKYISKISIQEK